MLIRGFYQLIIWVFILGGWCHSMYANVYATNIRLNGGTNTALVCPGHGVSINYILNEAASSGVVVEILDGTNLLKSFHVQAGQCGALRGANTLVWDGTDTNGLFVGDGLYSIRITAGSLGYESWTQISDDGNPGNQLEYPYSIAVNQNTNSPYYGRVFVGDAPPSYGGWVIDPATGIYKYNSDCSPSDDGGLSTGGYHWLGSWDTGSVLMVSPWKMEVSRDDQLLVNDWFGYGTVMGFDQTVSTLQGTVLGESNHPSEGHMSNLSGPAVCGSCPNTQILMADATPDASFGILSWSVGPDGMLVSNDLGTLVVSAEPGSDLSVAPWDVAVDKNGNIYTIQKLENNDTDALVLCFPPYDEQIGGRTNATWKITGQGQVFGLASGIAVNPEANHVAVAVSGTISQPSGAVVILDATNGSIITNIPNGLCWDVAWDNVGNLYTSEFLGWRVFSPPGTNQASTVGLSKVQVLNTITAPEVTGPVLTTNGVEFKVLGQGNVPYTILSSSNLVDWVPYTTNYSASAVRAIQIEPSKEGQFYRAVFYR